MTTQIIPAGESGEHTIHWHQMVSIDWDSMQAFEAALLDEARRRGLQISWREDNPTGDIKIYWRPEKKS